MWHVHMHDMAHSSEVQDVLVYVAWRIHMCEITCLVYMCDVIPSFRGRLHCGMCVMMHSYVRHDSFASVTWRIHSEIHNVLVSATWRIYMRWALFTHVAWCIYPEVHDVLVFSHAFIHATWLVCRCDMVHSFRGPRRPSICDMTHSYVWRDLCTRVTWHIHPRSETSWYIWHDAFKFSTWLVFICDMILFKHKFRASLCLWIVCSIEFNLIFCEVELGSGPFRVPVSYFTSLLQGARLLLCIMLFGTNYLYVWHESLIELARMCDSWLIGSCMQKIHTHIHT